MKDYVDSVHGVGGEGSAVRATHSAQLAVERVDVLGSKRLEWHRTESRDQVMIDDAFRVGCGRRGPVRGHRGVPVFEQLGDGDLRGHPSGVVDSIHELDELSLSSTPAPPN